LSLLRPLTLAARGEGSVDMAPLLHDLDTISKVIVGRHASAPLIQETEPLASVE